MLSKYQVKRIAQLKMPGIEEYKDQPVQDNYDNQDTQSFPGCKKSSYHTRWPDCESDFE